MYKISVLVSGTGTTLYNLAEHCRDQFAGILYPNVKIQRVIADRSCRALEVAQHFGIPAFVVTLHEYRSRKDWSDALFPDDVDLHVLAGFLGKVEVPKKAKNKILNIHPSLLPAYGGKGMYGIKVHQAVVDNKETESGCTVHIVDDEYDHGPIIDQAVIPVEPWDNAGSLQKAVAELEGRIYPRAILNYLQNN